MNKAIIGLIGSLEIGTKIDIRDELYQIINVDLDPITLKDVLYLDKDITDEEVDIYLIQVIYEKDPILCIGTVNGSKITIEEYTTIQDLVNSRKE
jgi:hypothetical protein